MSWETKLKKLISNKTDKIDYSKHVQEAETDNIFEFYIEYEWVDSIGLTHFQTLEYQEAMDMLQDLPHIKLLENVTVSSYGKIKMDDKII
jgi:hypothetical protein